MPVRGVLVPLMSCQVLRDLKPHIQKMLEDKDDAHKVTLGSQLVYKTMVLSGEQLIKEEEKCDLLDILKEIRDDLRELTAQFKECDEKQRDIPAIKSLRYVTYAYIFFKFFFSFLGLAYFTPLGCPLRFQFFWTV